MQIYQSSVCSPPAQVSFASASAELSAARAEVESLKASLQSAATSLAAALAEVDNVKASRDEVTAKLVASQAEVQSRTERGDK